MTHKNILVIQTAFIGDAILASSVLEKLHAFFPQAKISLLVRKGNESLYQEHPFLHTLLVWNKKEGKYNIHLSISHGEESAIAYAILEVENKREEAMQIAEIVD